MLEIKQNKGKDLHKIPKSKLVDGIYILSKKYDGHYVQIKYDGTSVQFWTSGGKEFYLSGMASDIIQSDLKPFHIECEFNYDCEGKLGDRGKSAILTTHRTNFLKGISDRGEPHKHIFRILDILDLPNTIFYHRTLSIKERFGDWDKWFMVPTFITCPSLEAAQLTVERWYREGYEGGMLKNPEHIYQPGKRTNDIIKLKPRPTADLLCIDWKEGTGKYVGMIGSLLLRDFEGRTVWAGSGLDDSAREVSKVDSYLNKVWEIEYERIDDTYIQPIIKRPREDKLPSEID